MSTSVEIEIQLLDRYYQEAKAACDQLAEASPQQEKPFKQEALRRIEIYLKQLGNFYNNFPNNEHYSFYHSIYYDLQALSLLGSSSGFRRTRVGGDSLVAAVAFGQLAKSQEKNNARQALSLLDKSIATHDHPYPRYMKALIYKGLGEKDNALREVDYILANSPSGDENYMNARVLRDEIQTPPRKNGCFGILMLAPLVLPMAIVTYLLFGNR